MQAISKVADVMTTAPVAVCVTTPFKAVAELLAASHFAAVPVVDDARHVVGMVSESDLLLKEANPGAEDDHHLLDGPRRRRELAKAAGVTAGDVMTTPARTVGPDASIAVAARLLHDARIHQAPVVDGDGTLIGIVSRGDLLRTYLRSDDQLVEATRRDILIRVLRIEPGTVAVTSIDGNVTLAGIVDRRSDVQIVTELVREQPGVVGVSNQLTYRFDDRRPSPN